MTENGIWLTTLLLAASLTSELCFAEQSVPLFNITKDRNKNVVHYDAQLSDGCKLDRYKPLKIYWIMGDNKTQNLSLIEKPLYNMDYDTHSEKEATGQVMAFKHRNIPLQITVEPKQSGTGCSAVAKVKTDQTGKQEFIDSVKLENFKGDSPKTVAITLRDEAGQKTTREYKF
jgi:hypothetical protein